MPEIVGALQPAVFLPLPLPFPVPGFVAPVGLLTVVVSVSWLLAGFVSPDEVTTEAVFDRVPFLPAFVVIVTVALAPATSVPRLQVTVLPAVWQVPAVLLADTKVTSPGSVSVTTTLSASMFMPVPRLAT